VSDAAAPLTPRAGFWRRAAAQIIDALLFAVVLGLAGILLFAPTDGRIRVSNMPFNAEICSAIDPQGVQLPVLPPFRVTHASRCTKTWLGHLHDRTLTVAQVTRSGALTTTRALTYAVDAEWRPMQAFYLDYLWFVLAPVYFLVLEWRFGRTLGKDLMDIRVRSLGAGPITFVQSAKRLFVRFLPVVFMLLLFLPIGSSFDSIEYVVAIGIIVLGSAIAIVVNFAWTVRRRNLPWHDRWAATEVVRGR
jgi:uncharacterized RDD family membrane protein YckC